MGNIIVKREATLATNLTGGNFDVDFADLETFTAIAVYVKGNTIAVGDYDTALLVSEDGTNFEDISVGETTRSNDNVHRHLVPAGEVIKELRVTITRNGSATGTVDVKLVAQALQGN